MTNFLRTVAFSSCLCLAPFVANSQSESNEAIDSVVSDFMADIREKGLEQTREDLRIELGIAEDDPRYTAAQGGSDFSDANSPMRWILRIFIIGGGILLFRRFFGAKG